MPDIVHTIPAEDLKEHIANGTCCHCKPRVEYQPGGGAVIIHNSYDGREFFEEDSKLAVDRFDN